MISVIMPAYNASRYIRPSIESVIHQSFSDWELLVVENRSSDDTANIVREYAANDPRIQLIVRDTHGSIGESMNIGIEAARYAWIAFLDADDIALPNRFEKQLAAVELHPEVVAWGSYAEYIDENDRVLHYTKLGPTSEYEFRRMRKKHSIPQIVHSSMLARKKDIIKVGKFIAEEFYAPDVDLQDRLADFGPIIALPEPLVQYRIHSNSQTVTKYFKQSLNLRYIWTRRALQDAGKGTLDYETFLQQYKARHVLLRLVAHLGDRGRFYWRQAGVAKAQKKRRKLAYMMALSMLCNPLFAFRRSWREFVEPRLKTGATMEYFSTPSLW